MAHNWLIHVNYQCKNKNENTVCTYYMGSNVICRYQVAKQIDHA